MSFIDPNSSIWFPRTEGDGLAEFATSFPDELAADEFPALRAEFERPQSEKFSTRRAPFYRHTEADDAADNKAHAAWLKRLMDL